MKWYSIKTHKPPMETVCLIFTENNYYYIAKLIDESNFSKWVVDNVCDEHGTYFETIYGVTHFCIPDPVEIEP